MCRHIGVPKSSSDTRSDYRSLICTYRVLCIDSFQHIGAEIAFARLWCFLPACIIPFIRATLCRSSSRVSVRSSTVIRIRSESMPAIYRQFDYAASNSSVPETVVVDDDNVQLHIRLLTETTTTSTDESTLFDTSGSLYASTTSEPENHHANFVWYEDWYGE